jgi:hypothetical protein
MGRAVAGGYRVDDQRYRRIGSGDVQAGSEGERRALWG